LVLAWQKLALYQEGHPARERAVERAHAVLVRLIAPTGNLALGVSRDALIGPEEKLSSAPASRLAAALYQREVALIRFQEGIEPEELEHLLCLLPRGVSIRNREPLATELAARGVRHVLVESVDFSDLVATDSLEDTGTVPREDSLWDRILQRLLADQRFSAGVPVEPDATSASAGQVIALINALLENRGATKGTRAVPGASVTSTEVLAALASLVGGTAREQVLEASDPEEQRSVVRHFAELLGVLPAELQQTALDAALREFATVDELAPAFLSFSGAVSAAQMIGSLRRLRSEGTPLSPRVLSLLQSLALEATPARLEEEPSEQPELLAQALQRVFGEGEMDEEELSAGVDERLSLELQLHTPIHARFADLDPYLETLTEPRLSIALATTLLDLLQRPVFDAEHTVWIVGRLQRVFRELLADGRFVTAVRIVESLRRAATAPGQPRSLREAAQRCLESLSELDSLSGLGDAFRAAGPPAVRSMRQLIKLLGPEALERLLIALGEEADLSKRRHIFDLLVALGPMVVPAALALIADSRWYVRRNMLSLLREVGQGLAPDVLRPALEHPEPRVRLEAVKCLPLATAEIPDDLVRKVIHDADARVAEAAVSTLGSARVAAASEPLVELLSHPDPFALQTQLRIRALQALGEIGDPSVLPRIGKCFRSWFAVVSTEEVHAAYETLRLYPEPARRRWVAKGRRAPDATVRQICRRLAAAETRSKAER
jgi:HEAT repeat protein